MSSTAGFLHRLRQFVQAEADAQWQALHRQWSRPLAERVAKGWTIEGLKVVSFDKNIARLFCDSNHARFVDQHNPVLFSQAFTNQSLMDRNHWLRFPLACPTKYCRLRTFSPRPNAICSTFLRVVLPSKPCI